jgi:hypothetical protein
MATFSPVHLSFKVKEEHSHFGERFAVLSHQNSQKIVCV